MTFTKTPENSTYRTVDLEFTDSSWYRSGVVGVRRDAEIINMFYERNSNENQTRSMALVKRAGVQDTNTSFNKSSSGSVINGFFQDDSSNYIYWATEDKVFSCQVDTNTVTQIATTTGTVLTSVNSVGFCGFLTSTGTRYVCFNNGSELWYHVVGTGVSTKVVDADYPASTYPTIVFLDGYLFVIKKDTGDIYNSDLDTPSSWTAGNYITAEINPDLAVALAKVKNYLVCFGRDGIEFFYDDANPSGSPLSRNESYYKSVTLTSNVCTIGDSLFFAASAKNQSQRIYRLDGESLTVISNSWVDRMIETSGLNTVNSNGLSLSQGFSITIMGHHFYIYNLPSSNLVLVYDIDTKFWYEWNWITTDGEYRSIQATWTVNSLFQKFPYIAFNAKSLISQFDNSVYQDFNENFSCSYTTTDYDSDTFNWKTCSRVGLYCDYPTTAVSSSYVKVSWSDDDGNTFSTLRNLNICSSNPYITQCGRFRSRNWRFSYSDNYPFRMWGITMDLNVGNV